MHDSSQNRGGSPLLSFRPSPIDLRFIAELQAKSGRMSARRGMEKNIVDFVVLALCGNAVLTMCTPTGLASSSRMAMRQGTLHFISGRLSAGKTTLARELAVEYRAVLISQDVWLRPLKKA